jgi:hypothetical protein
METRKPGAQRAARRAAVVLAIVVTPTAAVTWAGCSSSSSSSGGGARTAADPGGTFGAEVAVTVVGRGRVITSLPGLSCPSDCYGSFVFADRNEDGAAGGVTLKAIPTKGVRFAGWKFDTTSVGSRGRGPDLCNPVKRDSAVVPVDLNATEITLPYGEATGTAPAGQEAACNGVTTVPTAYTLTATFVDEIVDAGVDADAGADVFLESPVANAVGKEIGIAGGRLYWRYEVGGTSSIASAATSGIGGAQVVSGTTGLITAFEIGQHVVWQNNVGTIGVIQGGSTFATTFSSGGNTCVAVESDFSNVYCRTAGPNGTMISWTTAGTSMTNLHSGLPIGTDFTVDTSGFAIVDTTNGPGASAIRSVPKLGTLDAGVPTLTDLVTGLTDPTQLEASGTSRLFWIANDGAGTAQSASRFGGSAFSSTPATLGLEYLATDPQSSSSFFVGIAPSTLAGASSIVKLSAFSTTPTPVRQSLTGLGGVTADSSYVYWTQSDGRVYRAQRTTF